MSDIKLNAPKLFDLSGPGRARHGRRQRHRSALILPWVLPSAAQTSRCSTVAPMTGSRSRQTSLPRRVAASINIAADVTSGASLNEAVARTEAELGALTLAVNAAGIANANSAEEMEESQFQTMMDINLKASSCPPRRKRGRC